MKALRHEPAALLRVPLADLGPGEVELPRQAARYVARVHRLGPGDRFVAFDPEARLEAEAEIVRVELRRATAGRSSPGRAAGRERVTVRIGAPTAATACAAREVVLIQAIGKGAKLDGIVRDATELSATRLVPAVAERSVRRPTRSRSLHERWQRIAVEAARQCGRGDVLAVEPVTPLSEALRAAAPKASAAKGVCLAPTAVTTFGRWLAALGSNEPLVIVVGPEGGLAPSEIELAGSLGYEAVSFGPFVLRTETVCAAVLGAVLALGPLRER